MHASQHLGTMLNRKRLKRGAASPLGDSLTSNVTHVVLRGKNTPKKQRQGGEIDLVKSQRDTTNVKIYITHNVQF